MRKPAKGEMRAVEIESAIRRAEALLVDQLTTGLPPANRIARAQRILTEDALPKVEALLAELRS